MPPPPPTTTTHRQIVLREPTSNRAYDITLVFRFVFSLQQFQRMSNRAFFLCTSPRSFDFSFVSVHDGIYALGKAHKSMRYTPSLRSFPNIAFEMVRLTDDGPLSSFQGRSSSASSFHASFLQAIDGVMCLALSPQVVSQAPQH